MRILKFGGTSIGTSNQIKKVVGLINNEQRNFLVFSAIGGVTNLLVEFINQSINNHKANCLQVLKPISDIHYGLVDELFTSKNYKLIAKSKIAESIKILEYFINHRISEKTEKEILAQGEILSGSIIFLYMLEQEFDLAYIPSTKFLYLNKNREPNYTKISSKINKEINKHSGCKLFITNGFICLNHKGQIDNLNRGGSDFTATIIGNVLNASAIEIWTDIDGLQNNDPRFVENTYPIRNLSYDEAGELAYFGAKILHPMCIIPAQKLGIPIVLKNTMSQQDQGTIISEFAQNTGLKAIAAKDGISVVKIKSGRMMQAYGFLRRIFEVFEKHKTSVDMLTTSEISVAMTIDNTTFLDHIVTDLKKLGEVEFESNQTIISIVGGFETDRNISIQSITDAFGDIPIQMISFGASRISISILINTAYKIEALNLLNTNIFKNQLCLTNQ